MIKIQIFQRCMSSKNRRDMFTIQVLSILLKLSNRNIWNSFKARSIILRRPRLQTIKDFSPVCPSFSWIVWAFGDSAQTSRRRYSPMTHRAFPSSWPWRQSSGSDRRAFQLHLKFQKLKFSHFDSKNKRQIERASMARKFCQNVCDINKTHTTTWRTCARLFVLVRAIFLPIFSFSQFN